MNDQRDCRRRLLTITLEVLTMLWGVNACSADARPAAATAATTVAGAAAEDDAPSAAGASTELAESDWCAARLVLVAKCQRCHTAPPEHGAPFPLVSYADTQVVSARGARFVAIEAAVSKDVMPPSSIVLEPPVAGLLEPERSALLGWCRAGGLPAMLGPCDGEP